jgi:hypothetical protein
MTMKTLCPAPMEKTNSYILQRRIRFLCNLCSHLRYSMGEGDWKRKQTAR